MANDKKIRICFVLDSLMVPKWQAFLVERILNLHFVEAPLVIIKNQSKKKSILESVFRIFCMTCIPGLIINYSVEIPELKNPLRMLI